MSERLAPIGNFSFLIEKRALVHRHSHWQVLAPFWSFNNLDVFFILLVVYWPGGPLANANALMDQQKCTVCAGYACASQLWCSVSTDSGVYFSAPMLQCQNSHTYTNNRVLNSNSKNSTVSVDRQSFCIAKLT